MAGVTSVENYLDASNRIRSAAVAAMDRGNAARARRAELGLTQDDVRKLSGLSVTTISKIERGEAPIKASSLRRYDLAVKWAPGTAESWEAGRGGTVFVSHAGAEADELVARVVQMLKGEQALAGPTISVGDLPEPIVGALRAFVGQLSAAIHQLDVEGPRGARES